MWLWFLSWISLSSSLRDNSMQRSAARSAGRSSPWLSASLEDIGDLSDGVAAVSRPFNTAFIGPNYTIRAPWYMLDSHE